MILETFKQLLIHLGFEQKQNLFSKKFSQFDCQLQVDFKNKKLIYPIEQGLIVNNETTSNFSNNENFVVFECVHRLLTQGYKPESIELEPTWKLGHSNKSGRADILVKNLQNQPLLIIECKTAGNEFNKAWKQTQEDGGQLFSYLEQEKSVEFIALYASDFINNEIMTYQRIISHKDNEAILLENKDLKSFKEATNVKERFNVWYKTYKQEFTEKGIFEENIQAYMIGKEKYTLKEDTKSIDATDKKGKYHEFRTILRKYNVSRRENAFEVLVNLFLCKIVDETENPDDLKFYWKGIAYDSYFDLIDRLQALYKIGMSKFLKQEIVYISNNDIDAAFWAIKQDTNATKERIKALFKQLKFFKGLDFEFIRVHNQQGFDKNAKILLEIIQMWQGLRLLTNEQNQFLGDMFEFFLDNGIKQSEGQFFTPVPICKFIVSSLPLEDKIISSSEPLKTIDYACGAGHFLNEYALNIVPIIKKYKNNNALKDYYKNIYGIEKEDRLAKVAKVSAFMYGQDEINIIEADALDNNSEVKERSFDCLIANPPFAVEDFLLTLEEEVREKYELIQTVNELSNKNIQCFFLERAKQLLAPNGVAGIIVPSSILNNSDKTHIKTREILLKYFDFISIVELGSQTFGKTGTNTVILFIRRKRFNPEVADHFKNRVDDFFTNWANEKNSNGGVYQDITIVNSYCNHLEIDFNLYEKLLEHHLDEKLFKIEIFAEYKKAFEESKKLKNKSENELLKFIQEKEKEKLYFYMIAFNNAQKVLVVKSPSDNKDQKTFLGYEWSGAKGSEGIKYFGGENINQIQTPLFDPNNPNNENKINVLIKNHFVGKNEPVKEEYKEFCSYINLTEMLDFNRVDFSKTINLNISKKVEIESKWKFAKLTELVETINGLWTGKKPPFIKTIVIRNTNFTKDGSLNLFNVAELDVEVNQFKKRKLEYGDIIIEKSGGSETQAVGRVVFFDKKDGNYSYSNFTSRIRVISESLIPKYLHLFLNYFYDLGYTFSLQSGSSGIKNLNFDLYLSTKIPLPPLTVQKQIVNECQKVDEEVLKANQMIEESKQTIEQGFLELFSNATQSYRLSNSDLFDVCIGKRVLAKEIEDKQIENSIPVYSANVFEPFGYIKKDLLKDFSKDSVIWGIDGDWMVNFIQKETPFYPTDHCGVIRIKQDVLNGRYLAWILNKAGKENRFSRANRASTERIKSIVIKVPSIDEQNQFVLKIEILEAKINEAQKIIDSAKQKKEVILKNYL